MQLNVCDNTYLCNTVKSHFRLGGAGPVGPAMAVPTFELGRIFKKIFKNIANFLKSKVYRIIRPQLLTGK